MANLRDFRVKKEDLNKINFCLRCGTKLLEGTLFCPNCGQKINEDMEGEDSKSNELDAEQSEKKDTVLNDNIGEPEALSEETSNTAANEAELEENNSENTNNAVILSKLDELKSIFEEKIQNDEHRANQFDRIYEDNKKYENDIIGTLTNPIIKDVIQLIGQFKAQADKIPEEYTEENYKKLVKKFKNVPAVIEDLLYEHDVEPYSVEGDIPDMKLQMAVRSELTDDKDNVGKISERLTPGYKKGGEVLLKERIVVYQLNGGN